jgi:hypothetical protein
MQTVSRQTHDVKLSLNIGEPQSLADSRGVVHRQWIDSTIIAKLPHFLFVRDRVDLVAVTFPRLEKKLEQKLGTRWGHLTMIPVRPSETRDLWGRVRAPRPRGTYLLPGPERGWKNVQVSFRFNFFDTFPGKPRLTPSHRHAAGASTSRRTRNLFGTEEKVAPVSASVSKK